jgi:ferrous iron transport protein A
MFDRGFTVAGSSLKLLKPGERGVVSRLNDADDGIRQKLRSLGIMSGTTITLEQRFPRFIVQVGQDRFALDEKTIAAIYVRTTEGQTHRNRIGKSSTTISRMVVNR